MNKKVYIRQDGTIPGNRIIEELVSRGGENYSCLSGGPLTGNYYSINKANEIDFINPQDITLDYTELLYDKNNDTFYEKSQRMTAGEAKEAILQDCCVMTEGEYAIPKGYEAFLEDGKVIVRKIVWQPEDGEVVYVVRMYADELAFYVERFQLYDDISQDIFREYILQGTAFPTKEEAQAFCDELNAAIKSVLEERRKEAEK